MLSLGWACGPTTKVAQRKMVELAGSLGRLAGIELVVKAFGTYGELTEGVKLGKCDLAWLPPIPFLALVTADVVLPLAAVRAVPYCACIIVGTDSGLDRPSTLIGRRAAWVDRHSASGYVIPRVKLSRLGIDPRSAFSAERFHGSHDAVVQAVSSGAADFGATWAKAGREVVGPWSRMPGHETSVRALARFGNIPADVIAARADLPKTARKSVVNALKQIYEEKAQRWLLRDVLGTQAFYRPAIESYQSLQQTVTEAFESGVLATLDVRKTLEVPRAAARTIPDPVEMGDSQPPQQRWSLPEIEIEVDIDVDVDVDDLE